MGVQQYALQYPSVSYLAGKLSNKRFSDQQILDINLEVITKREEPDALRSATIVGFANKSNVTMYGKNIQKGNLNIGPGRSSIDLAPYGNPGAGVTIMPVYENQGEYEILVGRKRNSQEIILLGGYMKPHAREGAPDFNDNSDEEKDKAEEALLAGKSDAYINVPKTKIAANYDHNLFANAIREGREEANLTRDNCQIFSTSTRSNYGVTNDKKLHTIVADYIFKYSTKPQVKPGSDIEELYWVKSSLLSKDQYLPPQNYGSNQSRYGIERSTEKNFQYVTIMEK